MIRTLTLVVLIVALATLTGCASMHRAPGGQLTVDAMATPGGVATTIDASGRYTVSAAQAKVIEAQAEMMRACAADPARCPIYGYGGYGGYGGGYGYTGPLPPRTVAAQQYSALYMETEAAKRQAELAERQRLEAEQHARDLEVDLKALEALGD